MVAVVGTAADRIGSCMIQARLRRYYVISGALTEIPRAEIDRGAARNIDMRGSNGAGGGQCLSLEAGEQHLHRSLKRERRPIGDADQTVCRIGDVADDRDAGRADDRDRGVKRTAIGARILGYRHGVAERVDFGRPIVSRLQRPAGAVTQSLLSEPPGPARKVVGPSSVGRGWPACAALARKP